MEDFWPLADSSIGGQDPLDGQAVLERRRRRGSAVDRGEEVADFVGEGVFPADHVALRPPGVHVGVLGFVDQDPAEALFADRQRGVQEAEFVEVFQVEEEGALVAVDLQLQRVLLPGGHPGDLHGGDGPGGQGQRGPGGVVDRHLLQAVQRPGRLRHEGVQPAGDLGDRLAQQEQDLVDRVGGDVAQRPGPGGFLVQPPRHGRVRRPPASPAGRRRGRAGRCPSRPSAISSRARARAGTRR